MRWWSIYVVLRNDLIIMRVGNLPGRQREKCRPKSIVHRFAIFFILQHCIGFGIHVVRVMRHRVQQLSWPLGSIQWPLGSTTLRVTLPSTLPPIPPPPGSLLRMWQQQATGTMGRSSSTATSPKQTVQPSQLQLAMFQAHMTCTGSW